MAFWGKIGLVCVLGWIANGLIRTDELWECYYRNYGSPEQVHAYMCLMTIRDLAAQGDDTQGVESATWWP